MPAEPAALAAVVVHYRGVDMTLACVRSLPPDLPVVVVDNSGDRDVLSAGLADRPAATVVGEGRNVGFGQAANLGAASVDAEVLALVNPDARPTHEDLQALLALLRTDPAVAGVAPALVDQDGHVHNDGGGWLPTPARALAHSLLSGRAGTRGVWLRPEGHRTWRVEWLTGACALVRADAFAAVGGFAPEFVLYNEDMDLGRRLVERGHTLLVDGAVRVVHLRGGSSGGRPSQRVLRLRGQSLGFYVRRNAPSALSSVLTRVAFTGGFVLRAAVYAAGGRRERAAEMLVYARGVLTGPRPVLA